MIKLAPSLLAADFANLESEIKAVQDAGAHYLHVDVMDGMFVPNITIGPPVIKSIRKKTDIIFDVHLMINEPERYIERFADAGADIITVHAEACEDIKQTVKKIKDSGKRAGLSIKPNTPIEDAFPVLEDLDLILVMTVEPGFGGQKLITDTLFKIKRMKEYITLNGLKAEIEIDGGVGTHNIDTVLKYGAEVIVAGEAIFGAPNKALAVKEFLDSFERFGMGK